MVFAISPKPVLFRGWSSISSSRLGQLVAAGRFLYVALDLTDDPLGLVVAAVQREPARALRHVAAHQQDAERQTAPNPNASASRRCVEQVRIQQDGVTAAPNAAPSQ